MVKFVKGLYCVSNEELNKLIASRDKGEFVLIKGKQYIPLYIERKTGEVDPEQFKELVMTYDQKKTIYEKLHTSFYKFTKYCLAEYGTEDILKIREIINNRI